MKNKFCEVGRHTVPSLWRAKRVNKDTGEVIQQSCCKSCMSRQPIKPSVKKSTEKKELNVFFANQMLEIAIRCENCGSKLDHSSSFAIRSQTAHILPKSKFKSVAMHPKNRMFLCCFGGNYCHSLWDDHDAEKRKTMPVYKLALDRVNELGHLLTNAEKVKALKYLGL